MGNVIVNTGGSSGTSAGIYKEAILLSSRWQQQPAQPDGSFWYYQEIADPDIEATDETEFWGKTAVDKDIVAEHIYMHTDAEDGKMVVYSDEHLVDNVTLVYVVYKEEVA